MIDRKELARKDIARAAQARNDPERAKSYEPGGPRVSRGTGAEPEIAIQPGTFIRRSLIEKGDT
jgi:hypothetical protein